MPAALLIWREPGGVAMGLRFRRRLRIAPGVSLNLGKRGASVSVGVRGAHVTYGARGGRTTIGLPGSGLSVTEYKPYNRRAAQAAAKPGFLANLIGVGLAALFFSWLFGWL